MATEETQSDGDLVPRSKALRSEWNLRLFHRLQSQCFTGLTVNFKLMFRRESHYSPSVVTPRFSSLSDSFRQPPFSCSTLCLLFHVTAPTLPILLQPHLSARIHCRVRAVRQPDIAYTQAPKQGKSYCLLKRLSHSAPYCSR